jgi:hypothetical protein
VHTELLNRIASYLAKHPQLKGKPATPEEIAYGEKVLKVSFHHDYKTFIQQFGGVFVGISIHAFINGSSVGKETVIDLTLSGRKIAAHNNLFPELLQCYVISDDGSGNPIAINTQGHVLLFDFDTREITFLAENLETCIALNFTD